MPERKRGDERRHLYFRMRASGEDLGKGSWQNEDLGKGTGNRVPFIRGWAIHGATIPVSRK